MPIRDLLNVQLLSFTVSAALLGVGLALANQTHEMRQGEHYSEHYSGYIRTAAYFVAVFGALSQMYLYAAYIVPSITPGTKQVLSIRARVTLLLPLIVYGLFAMVYISTKAFIFENLPYTWYGWGSEEPYDHLARIFNGTDSKPPPGFPSDIDWRRMQVNGYVSSIIHEAGWKATVGTRVAGLGWGSIALGWTLFGLLILTLLVTLTAGVTIERTDGVISIRLASNRIALPMDDENAGEEVNANENAARV